MQELVRTYYHPYHLRLEKGARRGIVPGIDCHTMAAVAPPEAPDPGKRRPRLCVSTGAGTLPDPWRDRLFRCLGESFNEEPSLNEPFRGGYIIRRHSARMPWVQIEISREPFLAPAEKRERILAALESFCAGLPASQ